MTSILEGIRVVSMAEQYPGPYCTTLLADMGADVILIERPNGGDPSRQWPVFFDTLNRNKRSITLDLKSKHGMEICRQLMATADVFVEGFRPGVIGRLGLGYDVLSAERPGLVYCSISGFGQDTVYSDRPAHDLSFLAIAGMFFKQIASGEFGDPPNVSYADLCAGMFATIGILAALVHRTRTGLGQFIDVAMADGLVSWMGTHLVSFLEKEPTMEPDPSYRVYRCLDGKYLSLSIAHEDHFWRALCGVLGWPDMAPLTRLERIERGDEIKSRLREVFLTKERDTWVETLAKAGVASGPVLDLAEVVKDPYVLQRGLIQRVPRSNGESVWQVGHPIKFARTPAILRSAAPALGENTIEILRDLGLSASEISALQAEGAI
jgi:crotonobetainyl-CoA:carnitine CoA-transferase CaiB-like acyl-CoA transferase